MGVFESLSFTWQIAAGSVLVFIGLMLLVITSINIAFLDNTSELTAGGLKTINIIFLVLFGIIGTGVGIAFIIKSDEFHKKYLEITGKLPRAEQEIELQTVRVSNQPMFVTNHDSGFV